MIREARQVVLGKLTGLPWPVYPYIPEDVNEIPCVVVGRPSIDQLLDFQPGDFTTEIPVMVLGSRINDQDAQDQMDLVGDIVIARFYATHQFQVTSTLEMVAGLTYPAYTITVSIRLQIC